MFDLGCILNLCPSITLKKRKRKFGVIERIDSQLFQKVCGDQVMSQVISSHLVRWKKVINQILLLPNQSIRWKIFTTKLPSKDQVKRQVSGNQRWFRWGQSVVTNIDLLSTCIESNFGIVWFKGKSVRRSLKYILIRPSTNTTLPPIFWPSPLPSIPKLVHPVAIQVDEEVPGEKEHWGREILKSWERWGGRRHVRSKQFWKL